MVQTNWDAVSAAMAAASKSAEIAYQNARLSFDRYQFGHLSAFQSEQLSFQRAQFAFQKTMQIAQLTGYYKDKPTFEREKFTAEMGLNIMQLVASLRGPKNAFKMLEVLNGMPQGLRSLVQAAAGTFGLPQFGGGALPNAQNVAPATIQGVMNDINNPAGAAPTTPAAAGQTTASPIPGVDQARIDAAMAQVPGQHLLQQAGAEPSTVAQVSQPTTLTQAGTVSAMPTQATQVAQPAGSLPPGTPVVVGTPTRNAQGQIALPVPATGAAPATGDQEDLRPRVRIHGAKRKYKFEREDNWNGLPPGSSANSVAVNLSPPGTQAPVGQYNLQPNPDGTTTVYPPGQAAPLGAAQMSSDVPPAAGSDYLKELNNLPLPSQIDAQNYANMNPYQRDIMWAGYEAGGWDPAAAEASFLQTLPTRSAGPELGSFAGVV